MHVTLGCLDIRDYQQVFSPMLYDNISVQKYVIRLRFRYLIFTLGRPLESWLLLKVPSELRSATETEPTIKPYLTQSNTMIFDSQLPAIVCNSLAASPHFFSAIVGVQRYFQLLNLNLEPSCSPCL